MNKARDKKKTIKRICENCRLFNPPDSTCSVRLLVEGQVIRDVPVDPIEPCFWETNGFADQIKQVRFWVEDSHGNHTDGDGTVKIEYPRDLLDS